MVSLTKIGCARVSPLLLPYSEDALSERARAKVTAHLAKCQSCRTELTTLNKMRDVFRENPLPAAPPAIDLWARLSAQIEAETPALVRPAPQYATVTAKGQFRSFVQAFAGAGTVVAAVVVGLVFTMNMFGSGSHLSSASRTTVAPADETFTIILPKVAKRVAKPTKKTLVALSASVPAKPSKTLTMRRVATKPAPTVRFVASARPHHAPLPPRQVAMMTRDIWPTTAPSESPNNAPRDLIQPAVWLPDESESTPAAESIVNPATDMHRQQTLFSYGGR